MRIQKALARLGFGSRRSCEKLIAEGLVSLDGRIVSVGESVSDDEMVRLQVEGRAVRSLPDKRYLLLNKPPGFVTTVSDPQGRPTVMTLLTDDALIGKGRVYPVGRLDRQTLGVLLFTNDGELAHKLLHPSSGVEKEYLAKVSGKIDQEALRALRAGPVLDDGPTQPPRLVESSGREIRLVLKEGRKRQVRRMLKAVQLRCEVLERIRFGSLTSSGLDRGQFRDLTSQEIESLQALCQL